MTTAAKLSVVVEAKGVRETSSAIGGVQRSLAGAAKTALKFTAAYAGIRAAGDAIKFVTDQTVQFDRSMRNVNSISGQSSAQFAKLEKSVLKLAGPTAQSPVTLANGLYDLVSSGFKANESMGILKASAIAATAGLTDTATATKAVAAVLNAYHLPASKATAVSDTLFQTVNRGVITFEQLASTIGTVLPFANSLHVNLNQVGASLSTMTKQGIQADHATTYLKNAMVTFLKPNKDLAAAIGKTGAASGEALVQHRGFQGALEAVIKTTDGTKSAIQRLFPDIRASAAVFALTGSNAKMAAGDLKGFANTSGATQKVFKEQSKSVSVQWQRLKAYVSEAAITLGEKLVPAASSAVKAVTGFVKGMIAGTGAGGGFLDKIKSIGSAVVSVVEPIGQVALAIGKLAVSSTGIHAIEGAAKAFLLLKAATLVVGPLNGVALGLGNIALAARTAPSLGAFGADLAAMIGPAKLLALTVVGIGAAIAILGGNESTETQLANENAAAHKKQVEALKSLAEAERASADKGLAAKQSTLDLKQAKLDLAAAAKKYGKESLPYRQALVNEQQAALRASGAHRDYATQLSHQDTVARRLTKGALSDMTEAQKKLNDLVEQGQHVTGRASTGKLAARNARDLAIAQNNLTARTQEYVQALARAQVSGLNRDRLMHASNQITATSALGVTKLIRSFQGLPSKVQTRLLLSGGQQALAQAGELSGRLGSLPHRTVTTIEAKASSARSLVLAFKAVLAGVPPKKVISILQNAKGAQAEVSGLKGAIDKVPAKPKPIAFRTTAPQAKGQIDALKRSIDALHGKTIDITVATHHTDSGGGGGSTGANPPRKPPPVKAKVSSVDPMATTSSVAHQSTGYNALTDKIEHHTAAEWSIIRAKIAKSNAAKRRLAKYRQNYATPGELAISAADIDVADAGLTRGKGDDLKANQGRLVALRRRAVELKRKLAKGHLTKRQRVDARNTYAGILGDIGSEQTTIHDLKPKGPTAMGMAVAGLAVNSAIGTPANVIGSLTTIKGLWQDQLKSALEGGNAKKIATAADGLKAASDQLKQAADDQKAAVEAGRDTVAAGNDAALIRAQVDTPNSTVDDLAALNASLATDTGYYNDAVAAGDTAGISKWGSAILSVLQEIKGLGDDQAASLQEQLDLQKSLTLTAQRNANVANAQYPEFVRWLTGQVMGHGGQNVLRGSTTPAAGRVGSL